MQGSWQRAVAKVTNHQIKPRVPPPGLLMATAHALGPAGPRPQTTVAMRRRRPRTVRGVLSGWHAQGGVANREWCWGWVWLARRRGSQSPRKKAVNLARMTGFGTRSVPEGRESSMRGRKSQSFQARAASSEAQAGVLGPEPEASRMKRSPNRSVRRSWGLQKVGGIRNTLQGCDNSSLTEKGSKLAKAARRHGPCSVYSVSELVCGEG